MLPPSIRAAAEHPPSRHLTDCQAKVRSAGPKSAPDVVAWRIPCRPVPAAAHRRRPDAVAGERLGPPDPVLPPGAALPDGRIPPGGRRSRVAVGRLVPGLRAGRVDDSRDMATARQDVPDAAAE